MMLHGILPVWKPEQCTSHDVVAIIRRLAKQKKVGHTGTLDPSVTGVLPICLGKATRVAEYVQNMPKKYEGTLTLGIATDTQDQDGSVVEQKDVHDVTASQLEAVFKTFTGEITQVPPMYSAVKVMGRRLYDLAREGKEIERQARTVYIYRLEILHVRDGKQPQIDFRVECSKGTYVRTLCVDIGQALGYPAHMSHLVRVKSGPFTKQQCVTLSDLEQVPPHEWRLRWLLPLEAGLIQFPALTVSDENRRRIQSGQMIDLPDETYSPETLLRILVQKECLALYKVDTTGTRAKPVKVFAENR